MVCIQINNEIITINNSHLTILEFLESKGIIKNFQCRNGVCGTCRCKLISGNIEYTKEPIAFMQKDDVLICIAKVK